MIDLAHTREDYNLGLVLNLRDHSYVNVVPKSPFFLESTF